MNRKKLYTFFVEIILQKTIREGLLYALPFVITGSIALAVMSVPLPGYQVFIQTAADGQLYYILNLLHTYTMSITPLILIFTMSISFGRAVCQIRKEIIFYPIISFLSYLIFCEPANSSFLRAFSTMQTFNITLITVTACLVFRFLSTWKYTDLKFYTKTFNYTFNIIYRMILPASIVLILFAVMETMLKTNIAETTKNFHIVIFHYLGNNLFSTAALILLEHCYWFIGIHGFNMLDAVLSYTFQDRMMENINMIGLGMAPAQIYTKTFLDVFATIGGCGSILSLILSIFLFAKLPHTKRIAKLSLLPSIFNISEIILIGLPILCNFTLLIPFVLTPIVNITIAAAAMHLGLVPVTTHLIEWTIPPLINGYLSTGSISGAVLQAVILFTGILIYRPFIIKYERSETLKLKKSFQALIREVISCEKLGKSPSLLNNNEFTDIAKLLSSDLHQAIQQKDLQLYYQPQVNYDGSIYGGEALLRWKHPQFGYIYPPLIIFLATENDLLDNLGMYLIEKTCIDLDFLSQKVKYPLKLSVNVAPPQIYHKDFCHDIKRLLTKYNFRDSVLAFEITEQIALATTQETMDRLTELKSMGVLLSMDDFGMGHSSVMYLQNSAFDIVKLDGSLTQKVMTSERSVDIIRAITGLSKKFNFKVVAEYVETKEQRDKLAAMGCHIYQGWLYSQAAPLEVFLRYLNEHQK